LTNLPLGAKVEEMATEFPYLQVTTAEQKKLAGKPDKGTRIYRREGTYKESGEWCVAMDEVFEDQFVSPGGVGMFVPVSRAAVHKRLKEGRLTALCFHVVHDEKTFFGNVRKAKATPYVYIPVSECMAWAKEIAEKRGGVEMVDRSEVSQEFLEKDPEDRGNRKVHYTEKYAEQVIRGWIREEIEDARKSKAEENEQSN
jgi:hypothetical protein